ncbi:DedA family protein [Dermacoccus barathri]
MRGLHARWATTRLIGVMTVKTAEKGAYPGGVDFSALLDAVPAQAVYALTGLIILVESIGIPLPGEIMLVAASLLASGPEPRISIHGVAAAAIVGAAVGDSIGYFVGRHFGDRLFGWLGERFPHHVNDETIGYAKHAFHRHGVWAVFFGRFVALLRIFAGPLAGSLRMSYPRFLLANVTGAFAWAGGLAYGVHFLGKVAEKWMHNFSFVGLIVALAFGVFVSTVMRKRISANVAAYAEAKRAAGEEINPTTVA